MLAESKGGAEGGTLSQVHVPCLCGCSGGGGGAHVCAVRASVCRLNPEPSMGAPSSRAHTHPLLPLAHAPCVHANLLAATFLSHCPLLAIHIHIHMHTLPPPHPHCPQYGMDLRDGRGLAHLLRELSKMEGLHWIRWVGGWGGCTYSALHLG